MPEILSGRNAILKYLNDNHISKESLATAYGFSRVYVSGILSGKYTGKKANEFVIKVINDYGIK